MVELIVFGSIASTALFIFMCLSAYNRLMALDERCTTAFADIDVLLRHRHSLIPGLIEMVKGFAAHEVHLIDSVTAARAKAIRSANSETRLEAEMQLGQTLNHLVNFVEKYPEIRASAHFSDLRRSFSDVEERITASRRFFNITVDEHNATLRQFPGNLVASFSDISIRDHFDLGADRFMMDEPVAVSF